MAKDYIFAVKNLTARARSKRRREAGVGGTAAANGGGNSGSGGSETVVVEGHSHDNKALLDGLAVNDAGYLTSSGEKVKASYADETGKLADNSVSWVKILRRDVADTAAEVITFAKGMIATLRSYFNGGVTVSKASGDTGRALVVTGGTQTDTLAATGNVTIGGTLGTSTSKVSTAYVTQILATYLGSETNKVTTAYINSLGLSSNKVTNAFIETLGSAAAKVVNAYIQHLHADDIAAENVTTEYLTVTKAAHFFKLVIDELMSNKGAVIITSANAKVYAIYRSGTSYTLYFRVTDGDGSKISQSWRKGDRAICQTFNGVHQGENANVSSKYYWAKVTAVSTSTVFVSVNPENPGVADDITNTPEGDDYYECHWIVLSFASGDYDANATFGSTGRPEGGDEVVQLGYKPSEDTTPLTGNLLSGRQSAIILSAYQTPDTGVVPPSLAFYRGVYDFALTSHRKTFFDATGAEIYGNLHVGPNEDPITDIDQLIRKTYFAYCNNLNGYVDFTTSPAAGAAYKYLGTYTGTASSAPQTGASYTWSKIEGEPGNQGANGSDYGLKDCNSTVQATLPTTAYPHGTIEVRLRFAAFKYENNVASNVSPAYLFRRIIYVSASGKTGTNYSSWIRMTSTESADGGDITIYKWTSNISISGTSDYNYWSNIRGVELALCPTSTYDASKVMATASVPLTMATGATFSINQEVGSIASRCQTTENILAVNGMTASTNLSTSISQNAASISQVAAKATANETNIASIKTQADRIELSVQRQSTGGNYLQATDFVSLDDTLTAWTRHTSQNASDIDNLVHWSSGVYQGQHLMALEMSRYASNISHRLWLQQIITSNKLNTRYNGQRLCFSCYVKRSNVNVTSRFTIGIDIFDGSSTIHSFGYTGQNVTPDVGNSGTDRRYGQAFINDTEWHRIWIVFTPSSYLSIQMSIFAWRGSEVDYSNAPTVYIAMPKLEVGEAPTLWTAEEDSMRRAGISITDEEIHLEGHTTVNKGFSIGLDGSMEATNGTFAGFVRTKPKVIQAAELTQYFMDTDFITRGQMDANVGVSDILLPWKPSTGTCRSMNLMKTGAHIVLYGTGTMSVMIHLPFMHPHLNSFYSAFDYAYCKGITGQTAAGVMPTEYDGDGKATARWNLMCPAMMDIRSFIGSEVEIANMTGGSIEVCGMMGTLRDNDSNVYLDITTPWLQVSIPATGVLRATCVRVTEGGSNRADLEKIYWRVDSYSVLGRKYTAQALGIE